MRLRHLTVLVAMLLCIGATAPASSEGVATAGEWLIFSLKTGHKGDKIQFASNISGWEPIETQFSEYAPGFYSLAIQKPWLPYIQYKFIVNGQWTHDPSNPVRVNDGHGGFNSVVELDFEEDTLLEPPRKQAPIWQQEELSAPYEGAARSAVLLKPPFSSKAVIPLFVFHDGGDYLNKAFIRNVLHNYHAKTGRAVAALLIPPVRRTSEYGSKTVNAFDKWVTEIMVPLAESRVRAGGSPALRVIVGPSLGGVAALRQGLTSFTFWHLVSQSGAFWYLEGAMKDLVTARTNSPRILIENGIYEGYGISTSNDELQKLLKDEAFDFDRYELPSVHDWIFWRNRLGFALDWYFESEKRK